MNFTRLHAKESKCIGLSLALQAVAYSPREAYDVLLMTTRRLGHVYN